MDLIYVRVKWTYRVSAIEATTTWHVFGSLQYKALKFVSINRARYGRND
jgi:hypothetical protein